MRSDHWLCHPQGASLGSAPTMCKPRSTWSHGFPVPVSRSLQVFLLASQLTESAAGGEPCGEPAISPCLTGPVDYLFASRHKGPRFKSPVWYLCEAGILLLALSRYILVNVVVKRVESRGTMFRQKIEVQSGVIIVSIKIILKNSKSSAWKIHRIYIRLYQRRKWDNPCQSEFPRKPEIKFFSPLQYFFILPFVQRIPGKDARDAGHCGQPGWQQRQEAGANTSHFRPEYSGNWEAFRTESHVYKGKRK